MLGLIIPANLYFCPYVKIYTNMFDSYNIDYEIISLNKDGMEENVSFHFDYSIKGTSSLVKKLCCYYTYSRFVKRIVRNRKYDKLIIFGPQIGLFLYSFLRKKYNRNFIFDYRDLSIDQYCQRRFNDLLKISSINVISSPGFEKLLPDGHEYILSHNFDISLVRSAISQECQLKKCDYFTVLTIGGIRDYEANVQVIDALKNRSDFSIYFIGKGVASEPLRKYCLNNDIENAHFKGFYQKQEEKDYILSSDVINIFYPRKRSHDTAISNRFYNALIYKKPMITTVNTIQGDYVEKYKLGCAVKDCYNLAEDIKLFYRSINSSDFLSNCTKLLTEFEADYCAFERAVLNFIKNEC